MSDCITKRFDFLFPRKSAKKLFRGYSVKDFYCALLLAGIEVAVSVPSHLDVAVTQAAGDLLNVDALIRQ